MERCCVLCDPSKENKNKRDREGKEEHHEPRHFFVVGCFCRSPAHLGSESSTTGSVLLIK